MEVVKDTGKRGLIYNQPLGDNPQQIYKQLEYITRQMNKRIANLEYNALVSNAFESIKLEYPSMFMEIDTKEYSRASITNIKNQLGDLTNPMNRMQAELIYSKMQHFMNLKTSTVRGAKDYIKKFAKFNGMSYNEAKNSLYELYQTENIEDLQYAMKDFYRLSNLIEISQPTGSQSSMVQSRLYGYIE